MTAQIGGKQHWHVHTVQLRIVKPEQRRKKFTANLTGWTHLRFDSLVTKICNDLLGAGPQVADRRGAQGLSDGGVVLLLDEGIQSLQPTSRAGQQW